VRQTVVFTNVTYLKTITYFLKNSTRSSQEKLSCFQGNITISEQFFRADCIRNRSERKIYISGNDFFIPESIPRVENYSFKKIIFSTIEYFPG
jgi:hypothetical protein